MDAADAAARLRAIERILPHRYPFLLVDRITELEPDKRIVGIKNVSLNERYPVAQPGEPPARAADDPHRVRRAGRRDPDPVEAGEPRQASFFVRHRARALPARRSTPETSWRSKRGSSGSAAAWDSSMASRASTARSSSRAR